MYKCNTNKENLLIRFGSDGVSSYGGYVGGCGGLASVVTGETAMKLT